MRRIFLIFSISLLLGLPLFQVIAQDKKSLEGSEFTPEFMVERCFDIFRNTLNNYNTTTDSLFLSTDKQQWAGIYRRRSEMIGVSNASTREAIGFIYQQLEDRVAQERAELSDTLTYSALMSDSTLSANNLHLFLLKECINLFYSQKKNKFYDGHLLLQFVTMVLPDLERYMPHSEVTMATYSLLSQMYANMLYMEVEDHARQCVDYAQKALAFEPQFDSFSDDELRLFLTMDYFNLLSKYPLISEIFTLHDGEEYAARGLRLVESHPDFFSLEKYANWTSMCVSFFESYQANMVLNYVVPNYWNFHDSEYEEVAKNLIHQSEKSGSFNRTPNFYNYQVMKVYTGQTSFTDAWVAADEFYHSNPLDFNSQSSMQVAINTSVLYSLSMLCDSADVDIQKKHDAMLGYTKALTRNIQSYAHYRMNNVIAPIVYRIMTNVRFYNYLTETERADFFYSLLPYVQIRTLRLQRMSGALSKVITQAIIDHKPELLVGAFDFKSLRDVKKSKTRQRLLDFMQLTSDCYELGNNAIPDMERCEYRPYMDFEYDVVITHPEQSMKILIEPSIARHMREIILGTHKWYNGQHGYPGWFNNQMSSDKILVDVMALSNYLSEPTDKFGYRMFDASFDFDKLFAMAAKDSGTRFNPDLVDLIVQNRDVYDQLKQIVNEGWADIYYDIYSPYFGHTAETE